MTSAADFVQPPRVATWLVNLFTSSEEESITGDLQEEFSQLAKKSGLAFARRWYWRQTLKTIAHLFGSAFRVAPWSTTAVVVGGFFLLPFVSQLPDKVLSVVTDRYLAYWSNHFSAYMFLATDGMLIAHLILSMLVGCIVAFATKGREMVATMTLGLVLSAMAGVAYFGWVAEHWPIDMALSWMLFQCSGPFAIVLGGAIVRTRRATAKTRPSCV
jgi:hypothetical protein